MLQLSSLVSSRPWEVYIEKIGNGPGTVNFGTLSSGIRFMKLSTLKAFRGSSVDVVVRPSNIQSLLEKLFLHFFDESPSSILWLIHNSSDVSGAF